MPRVGVMTTVLLVASPNVRGADGRSATSGALAGLAAAAQSLRAAGFKTETYGSKDFGGSSASIAAHIEHAWPDVVVAVADGACGAAVCEVLRIAREIVPSVTTVFSGALDGGAADELPPDRNVDYVVNGCDAAHLVGLLIRLRAGELPQHPRSRKLRRLLPAWSSAALSGTLHGR